jgi:hypothetical protein
MKSQASLDLFHYWNRLRADRPAPARSAIEPADIKALLSDTFILEQDSRGTAVFRLAGTRLCATHGRELKGFSFVSMWSERDQRVAARLCHAAFHDKTVVSIAYIGRTRSRREARFELLLLPLAGGRESLRCLGIASAAERPFWIGAEPVTECLIETVRVIDPDLEPLLPTERQAVAVPSLQPNEHFLLEPHGLESPKRIRHLVVIDGGRDD